MNRLLGAVLLATLIAVPTQGVASAQTPVQDGAPICGVESGIAPGVDDGVLRIASYNVLHTRDSYAAETMTRRVELLADAMTAADVDIAGLQEVTNSNNHGVVAQRIAAAMASRTGDSWSWCFYQSNPHVTGEPDTAPGGVGGPSSQEIANVAVAGDSPWAEGVAVISRFEITDQLVHRLPPRGAEVAVCIAEDPTNPLAGPTCQLDTRTIMFTRIDTSCGGFDFFTSHLANNESSQSELTRIIQMTDALQQIDQLATDDTTPDVYTGDFNTLAGGPVHQLALDAGFIDSYLEAGGGNEDPTTGQDIDSPTATAERRIDFIFARPGSAQLTPSDPEIIGDAPAPFEGSDGQTVTWPSDHYGVVTTLNMDAGCEAGAHTVTTVAPAAPAAPPPVAAAESLPATGGRTALLAAGLFAIAGVAIRRRLRAG